MSRGKGPKNKHIHKGVNPESIDGKRPGQDTASTTPERVDDPPTSHPAPAPGDTRRETVTNQDEQDKITNAGEGDLPVADK